MARAGQFDVGALCFFEDDDHSWLLGKVLRKSDDGKAASVVPVDDDGNELDDSQPRDNLALTQLAPVADGSLDAVKDLIDMPYLHEAVLLYHIRKRYWADFVYSNIGPIVLAVNPYNFNIAHYSDERMDQYIEEKQSALSSGSQQITHLWSVAHEAYWLMKTTDRPQSILVSGESGAGKTEAAKIVAHYLARCSTHFSEPEMREAALKITKRVVATSPVLEAFGNAKTARNDNSSRFGKFMKLKFNASGTLMGTFTKHYLLEKSRIITHGDLERCFHTYYQITAGASPEDRERYQLDNPRIRWIYEGYEPSEEELASDKQAYHEVREAMDVVGLTPEEQRQVYDVIAGILHFQGVQIAGEEAAELGDDGKACIGLVAGLWGVSAEELEKDILTTSTVLRGEVIVKQLTLKQAIEMRDGLSKALYERLFSWLIAKINEVLDVPDLNPGAEEHWIGLLDIFGFENFTANSLEQFLINLANEQLQNHYNACVFARDLALYEKEGIDSTTLEPPDNSHTLDLLKGKGSIIDHLNDACRTQSANDGTFLSTINDNFGPRLGDKSHVPHQSYVKKKIDDGSYGVKHYASDVWYNVDGFKLKNLDTLKDAFKVLMRTSSKPLIAGLLPEPEDAAPKGKAALRTTATRFRLSLDELLQLIDQTEPHWIRCVKPHSSKKARRFHGAEVMNQLRCAGVLETVKIRQNGYSMRVDHEQFWKRFCIVLDKPSAFETLDGCRELLARVSPAGTKNGQVGRTKIFLKDVPYKALEKQRDDALAASGVLVQAFARARVSVTRRHAKHLELRVRTIQSFTRTKQGCHQRYYRQLVAYGVVVQSVVRAKVSSGVRAQKQLLQYCALVQGFARCKESSRARSRKALLRNARQLQAEARWKLACHQRYYRGLAAKSCVISGFASSLVSQGLVRQKEYELWHRRMRAAMLIQSCCRPLLSVAVSHAKRDRVVSVIQAFTRGALATAVATRLAVLRDLASQLVLTEATEEGDRSLIAVEFDAELELNAILCAEGTAFAELARESAARKEEADELFRARMQREEEERETKLKREQEQEEAERQRAEEEAERRLAEEKEVADKKLGEEQAQQTADHAAAEETHREACATEEQDQRRRIHETEGEAKAEIESAALQSKATVPNEPKGPPPAVAREDAPAPSLPAAQPKPAKIANGVAQQENGGSGPKDALNGFTPHADVAGLVKETEERRRQLEVVAAQLGDALANQASLQSKVAALERQLEAEQLMRTEAEEHNIDLQQQLSAAAGIGSPKGERLDDPEYLAKLLKEKAIGIKYAKAALDQRENEYLQLEKRRQLVLPVEDTEFHEMVANHTNDICTRVKAGRSSASAAPDAKRDVSVSDLINMLADAHDQSHKALPPAVAQSLAKMLAEVRTAGQGSAHQLASPCLTRAQSIDTLQPLTTLLADACACSSAAAALGEPLPQVSSALSTIAALSNSRSEVTVAKQRKACDDLSAARVAAHRRLEALAEQRAGNAAAAERLAALRKEQSRMRSYLKQHRTERDEAGTRAKLLGQGFKEYEDRAISRLEKEEHSATDYHKALSDRKMRLAAKLKEVEAERKEVFALEIKMLQNQRQNSRFHELLQAVKRRVNAERADCETQQVALQMAALLKVKQLGFIDASEAHLAGMLRESAVATEKAVESLLPAQLSVCEAEWSLAVSLQRHEMLGLASLQAAVDDEASALAQMERDRPQQQQQGSSLFGSSPQQKIQKQRKKVDALVAQGAEAVRGLQAVRAALEAVAADVRGNAAAPPEVRDAFDVASMEWPSVDDYRVFMPAPAS